MKENELKFSLEQIEEYMKAALSEARFSLAHGDVPVGAVIVDANGQIISKAHNTRKETGLIHGHAEINAINAADLSDGEYYLFVTLEPCPMCAGAILDAGIKGVFYGAQNTTNGALGTVLNVALSQKPYIFGGFSEAECRDLLKQFFNDLRVNSL